MSARGWFLFAAMGLIWGLPYLLIRVSVKVITPAELVFARTAIAALLLMPLALARHQVGPVLRHWRPLLAYTVAEIALPWLLLSSAEQRITSSLSGLLIAAVPLVGMLISRTTGGGDRMTPWQVVGLAVGVGGVAAVMGSGLGGLDVAAGVEMAVVIVGYATGPQILARYLGGLPGVGVVACSLAACALAYLPIAVIQRPRTVPGGDVLASVLGLGLVCTALAFVLFFSLINEVGAVRATVITYVNPAVAVVLGVAVLQEPFGVGTGVGFALILLGSALATRALPPRRRAALSPDRR